MGKLLDLEMARLKRSPAHVQISAMIVEMIDTAERARRGEEQAASEEQAARYAQHRRAALQLARKLAEDIAQCP